MHLKQFLNVFHLHWPGLQPAWDTRGDEEFSESGPNFLKLYPNYVQHIFPGGRKILQEAKTRCTSLVAGLA